MQFSTISKLDIIEMITISKGLATFNKGHYGKKKPKIGVDFALTMTSDSEIKFKITAHPLSKTDS